MSWLGGGGIENPHSFKIDYRAPTRAASRKGSSTLAESSRVFFGVVILNSDWLTKFKGFSYSVLIGCGEIFDFGQILSVFGDVLGLRIVRVWAKSKTGSHVIKKEAGFDDSFSALWDFERKVCFLGAHRRAGSYYGVD